MTLRPALAGALEPIADPECLVGDGSPTPVRDIVVGGWIKVDAWIDPDGNVLVSPMKDDRGKLFWFGVGVR